MMPTPTGIAELGPFLGAMFILLLVFGMFIGYMVKRDRAFGKMLAQRDTAFAELIRRRDVVFGEVLSRMGDECHEVQRRAIASIDENTRQLGESSEVIRTALDQLQARRAG